jgi:hypothetical protein
MEGFTRVIFPERTLGSSDDTCARLGAATRVLPAWPACVRRSCGGHGWPAWMHAWVHAAAASSLCHAIACMHYVA